MSMSLEAIAEDGRRLQEQEKAAREYAKAVKAAERHGKELLAVKRASEDVRGPAYTCVLVGAGGACRLTPAVCLRLAFGLRALTHSRSLTLTAACRQNR